jgi:NAD dependent epimerase/dehydratase family enzyme
MLLPFKLGAGGPIGNGRQGFSWIALDDAIYAIHHVIRNEGVRGPVNVVAPDPLPQREFATALGRALHRPAFIPLPAPVVRALFGQLGEEALLGGQFVEPTVLRRSGFTWSAGSLEEALSR